MCMPIFDKDEGEKSEGLDIIRWAPAIPPEPPLIIPAEMSVFTEFLGEKPALHLTSKIPNVAYACNYAGIEEDDGQITVVCSNIVETVALIDIAILTRDGKPFWTYEDIHEFVQTANFTLGRFNMNIQGFSLCNAVFTAESLQTRPKEKCYVVIREVAYRLLEEQLLSLPIETQELILDVAAPTMLMPKEVVVEYWQNNLKQFRKSSKLLQALSDKFSVPKGPTKIRLLTNPTLRHIYRKQTCRR